MIVSVLMAVCALVPTMGADPGTIVDAAPLLSTFAYTRTFTRRSVCVDPNAPVDAPPNVQLTAQTWIRSDGPLDEMDALAQLLMVPSTIGQFAGDVEDARVIGTLPLGPQSFGFATRFAYARHGHGPTHGYVVGVRSPDAAIFQCTFNGSRRVVGLPGHGLLVRSWGRRDLECGHALADGETAIEPVPRGRRLLRVTRDGVQPFPVHMRDFVVRRDRLWGIGTSLATRRTVIETDFDGTIIFKARVPIGTIAVTPAPHDTGVVLAARAERLELISMRRDGSVVFRRTFPLDTQYLVDRDGRLVVWSSERVAGLDIDGQETWTHARPDGGNIAVTDEGALCFVKRRASPSVVCFPLAERCVR